MKRTLLSVVLTITGFFFFMWMLNDRGNDELMTLYMVMFTTNTACLLMPSHDSYDGVLGSITNTVFFSHTLLKYGPGIGVDIYLLAINVLVLLTFTKQARAALAEI